MNEPKRRGRPPKIKPEAVNEPQVVPAEPVVDAASVEPVSVEPVVTPDEPQRPVLSNAQRVALDRDRDGEPGGSFPKASLAPRELAGFVAEFFYAFEMQQEIKRTDTFNRVWTFRLENVKNTLHMMAHVKRGPVEAQQMIVVSHMPRDVVEAMIIDLDGQTSR